MYFASPLALFALPQLRRLTRPLWWVLGFYTLSQQLPALLSPDPLLASGLALARTALMLGLIGVGALLGRQRLGIMGIGLAAVYVTALGIAVLQGDALLAQRLTHPYMTSTTLGLLGAAGMWIAVFAGGRVLWRVPLGMAALGVLLLTGSRGALAAAVLGTALGLIVRSTRRLALGLLIGSVALTAACVTGQQLGIPALERLNSTDTSGRDVIWYNTLSVIQSAPVAGVGSYLLGDRLAPPGDTCTLWPTAEGAAPCPAWIARLGHPWLIAHNVTLQQLAESGPLGLLGLFVLLGVVVAAAVIQRNALGVAVLSGLLLASANDNTLLVPGPFVGELFWIIAGAVLAGVPAASPALGWLGGVIATTLLGLLSGPLIAAGMERRPPLQGGLNTLIAARQVTDIKTYSVLARYTLPPGLYRVVLRTCSAGCVPVTVFPSTLVMDPRAPENLMRLEGSLLPTPHQRVELLLYPRQSTLNPVPLAQTSWTVEWRP